MKFHHPLMHNNFTKSDMNAAIKLLRKKKYKPNSIQKCSEV